MFMNDYLSKQVNTRPKSRLAKKYKGKLHLLSKEIQETQQTNEGTLFV